VSEDIVSAPVTKKYVFSGIQPTGSPTLGNYLGALRNWSALQDKYNCIYSVVDMHSITVRQDPAQLRRHTLELLALLLSIGIDPQKSLLFIQSHVHTHAELAWVLDCYTQFGELSRMIQFKEKSAKHADNINAGLFSYPSLMAADILLYQSDLVPIGADQKQHLELARNVAERFNGVYGETFKVPEPYIPKLAARVMSLQEPTKKMSKSDENSNSYILVLDKPDDIMRKFKRAVTDSDMHVAYSEGKDGINNLMSIYACATGKSYESIEAEFDGKGYDDFKTAVGEAVVELLRPIQERFADILKNKDYLESVYTDGAKKALAYSLRTYDKVCKKVGFVKRSF
jgi:tryptophanyl-tRNA synthetase